jgi:hypothetical protein
MRPNHIQAALLVLASVMATLSTAGRAEERWLSDACEARDHDASGYWDGHNSTSAQVELVNVSHVETVRESPGSGVGCDTRGCDTCGGVATCGGCGPFRRAWFDNTAFFFAGDGWKNIFDDDDNNNFGLRVGFNTGLALPGVESVRGQIGASYGAYDFHGREGLLGGDDSIEEQLFLTAGLFRRSDVACGDRLSWAVAYDLLAAENAGEGADDIRLAQLRWAVGYSLDCYNEIGVWATFRLMSSFAWIERVRVSVMDQVNAFWHHTWSYGGDTWLYVGWADDPGETVLGLRGEMPMNDRVALFGNLHYVIPSTRGGDQHPRLPVDDVFAQEAWNVTFGIVFYPGARAGSRTVSGDRRLPLLPVADNGSFGVQAPMF